MRDLRPDLAKLWNVASRRGEGTSSMAASFALMAAGYAERTAWLVDLALMENAAYDAFDAGFASGVARPGRAYDASLGCAPMYELMPATQAGTAKLLTAHPVTGTRLLVTRFRTERLARGQVVRLRSQPGWWQALRRSSDWIIVDAPALDRSDAALDVANEADVIGVVLNRMRADARFAGRIAS